MMRILAVVATVVMLASGAMAKVRPVDIPLPDILRAISARVATTSDQAFFETDVLQGHARRGPYVNGPPGAWDYAYDYGDGYGKGSLYKEAADTGGTKLTFHALDITHATPASCFTLKAAQDQLVHDGWSVRQAQPGTPDTAFVSQSLPGESVSQDYMRDGVILRLSNDVNLTPAIISWDPPTMSQKEQDDLDQYGQERLKIIPGSDTFNALCFTSVTVTFTR